jgi:predicted TPR repeat methyltransferase
MSNKNNIKGEALKFLKGAYEIKTPEDNINYYKKFSKHYDNVFAYTLDYSYPQQVVKEFIENYNNEGSICDIGCGTGLVGYELKYFDNNLIIDGFDISPEMISVAREKNIYRKLYEIDLTKPIENVPNNYAGIISAGVFTHGHLGPEIIYNLLSICKKGAILTIGINALYYKNKKFENFINYLEKNKKITINKIASRPIYADSKGSINKENNIATICTFIKN